jgi:lactoylglutathione lyase
VFETPLLNLYSSDVEAALSFYRDLLGFQESFRTPKEGTPDHVELGLDGFTIALSSAEAAKRAHGVDATPGSPAVSLVFWTDNVDASYDRLVAAGCPSVQAPTTPATTTATRCSAILTGTSSSWSRNGPELIETESDRVTGHDCGRRLRPGASWGTGEYGVPSAQDKKVGLAP